jgi:acid stress chaperone HdeB
LNQHHSQLDSLPSLAGGFFGKETLTMKRLVTILLATASIGLAGSALAAEVDMSKATCKDVGAVPAAQTIGVAMWVNGYVHGKAGNAMVDTAAAHANAEKIADYCKANPNSTVVDAIAAVAKS